MKHKEQSDVKKKKNTSPTYSNAVITYNDGRTARSVMHGAQSRRAVITGGECAADAATPV